MNKKTIVGISYVSAWIIIWGTIGSLIDFYFLQSTYLPGSLGQFLTFIISGIASSIAAIYIFPSINKKNFDTFSDEYNKIYKKNPNEISFLSYDIIGLVYYLLYKNNFLLDDKLFYKKNNRNNH